MNGNSLSFVFCLACAALAIGGCGERLVDVGGRVTYNGAPLNKPDGQIVFVGPKGTQVAAPIGRDGTYHAIKVPAGLNRVAVFYPNPAFKIGKQLHPPPGKGNEVKAPEAVTPGLLTPRDYASVDTSGLSIEVKTGTDYNPDLKGPMIP